MIIEASRFGQIEVDDKDIILIPEGLIGFSELTQFVLLDHDADSPFKWLQSVSDPDLAFVVISPLIFRPDYMVEVTDEEVSSLNLKAADEAVVSVIVTIPPDPKKMSANLRAPLIFNLSNRRGKQFILRDSQYQTKHFILEEMRRFAQKDAQISLRDAIQRQMIKGVDALSNFTSTKL